MKTFQKFVLLCKEDTDLNTDLLKHRSFQAVRRRWQRTILPETNTFGAVYKSIKAVEKSGWNEENVSQQSMQEIQSGWQWRLHSL
jgi:hypothetical protein